MNVSSRRAFLSSVAAGSAALASGPLLAQYSKPGSVMPTQGNASGPLPKNDPTEAKRFVPSTRLGLGGVAVGNGFAPTSDEEAQATLAAAWDSGVRYFDTSPYYGFGLSERRYGWFLHNHPADDYVLSTKVGRVFHATDAPRTGTLWKEASPFDYKYDYTADGARRSIEDSLERLGVSQIDIAFIHDLSPDNGEIDWQEQFEIARKGAMPELTKMREEGMIKAWGFGVNRPAPALNSLEVADPDIMLLACQYSLIDHDQALHDTLPKLAERNVSVVVGAPLMAGYLAGRDRYLYGGNVPEGAPAKRSQLSEVVTRYGIDLRTASLQFAAANPTVSSVIPGARTPAQAEANAESMRVKIPTDLWSELKHEGLIANDAPVPAEQA
ncbi:aldo/keto reductase [Aeoliella mucimassa]|uniref:Pyridoxal 4-dehydrogenase n=1 Tax=Aeoliella mucimassa TaxID=2527972 RepID=A0A518AN14_9BACT|nr:aldo/keto reductase [Aeoliella mucimassa]QDU56122.1 Pyridoxal 4-dehydrogenase [Aeoliella mucimassa]